MLDSFPIFEKRHPMKANLPTSNNQYTKRTSIHSKRYFTELDRAVIAEDCTRLVLPTAKVVWVGITSPERCAPWRRVWIGVGDRTSHRGRGRRRRRLADEGS
ncbi:hypothetical protein U1Q18_028654 [Sarracenia purpurea var. burkii]